jgi:Domain of unknown function (DUF4262)
MKQRPELQSEDDRSFIALIDKYGWAVKSVFDEHNDEPPFNYSAGIYEKLARPELLVIGLPQKVGHWVVNEYAQRCASGSEIVPGGLYDGFLEGHRITFLELDSKTASADYTTWTEWYYHRQRFPLLQLVWPDAVTGAFPWQENCGANCRAAQPLLAVPKIPN